MLRYGFGSFGTALVLVLAGLPDGLSAQTRSCDQVLASDTRRIINPRGQELIYFRDPVRVLCTGGIRIEADSAVMNRSASTVELIGQVVYVDGEQRLTSDWANYLGPSDELFARGMVVLTGMTDGSVITGDELEYRRQTETRPESRMIVRGRTVHSVLRSGTPGQPADTAGAIEVWSRRVELLGETVFVAQTDVRLQRGEMRGQADHARFDQAEDRMTLTGNARVEDDAYRLDAGVIDAFLVDDVLREVLAERSARLAAEDLTVHAERIRIAFADGQLERMEAWNPRPANGVAPRRALAIAEDFHLRADSIDALADAGRLREVRAVGRAFGERDADTDGPAVPDVIARDWIQGDTIIGYFAQQPVPAPEDGPTVPAVDASDGEGSEAPREATVLEKIDIVGGSSTALSLYRMEPKNGAALPSVNFMRANRIVLFMQDGEVSRVEADGPIEGLYLDAAPPRPADSEPSPPAAARS